LVVCSNALLSTLWLPVLRFLKNFVFGDGKSFWWQNLRRRQRQGDAPSAELSANARLTSCTAGKPPLRGKTAPLGPPSRAFGEGAADGNACSRRHRSTIRRGSSTPRWRPVAARWQRPPKKGQLNHRPAAGRCGRKLLTCGVPQSPPFRAADQGSPRVYCFLFFFEVGARSSARQGNETNTPRRSNALLMCRLAVF
jgi:hypothetical protein